MNQLELEALMSKMPFLYNWKFTMKLHQTEKINFQTSPCAMEEETTSHWQYAIQRQTLWPVWQHWVNMIHACYHFSVILISHSTMNILLYYSVLYSVSDIVCCLFCEKCLQKTKEINLATKNYIKNAIAKGLAYVNHGRRERN